jgi:S-adenosylmethionine:tRNA ribosyltransferase-isomerase
MKKQIPFLKDYDFRLPKGLIALAPVKPRDAAKLMVYDQKTKRVFHDFFRNLHRHIPRGSALVLNDTKVFPARLTLRRVTGGRVRVLFLQHARLAVPVLADRKLSPNEKLLLNRRVSFVVAGKEDGRYVLRLSGARSIPRLLKRYGTTPLPPYLRHSPLTEPERQREYQSLFAKHAGSAAAPTASLHFTRRLLSKLKRRGIDIFYITLHVGLGTFAPVTPANLKTGKLHRETYVISPATWKKIMAAKQEGRAVVAAGTTVLRALESAAQSKRLSGDTRLFIQEGFQFKIADGLITNFHVPRSSLLMLVSAFCGRTETLRLYRHAIKKRYRFFSFGDGMFLRLRGRPRV